jgi:hypothetical protein
LAGLFFLGGEGWTMMDGLELRRVGKVSDFQDVQK